MDVINILIDHSFILCNFIVKEAIRINMTRKQIKNSKKMKFNAILLKMTKIRAWWMNIKDCFKLMTRR
jgi:hypothetical protein